MRFWSVISQKERTSNRGTFYLHYQDKFDYWKKTQTEIIENLERIILQTNSLDLSDFDSVENPLPVVVALSNTTRQMRVSCAPF